MSAVRRPSAVVTGASSGIGAALCRYLLSNDWEVCMIARSTTKMESIAAQYPSELSKIISADLSDNTQTKAICKEILQWCGENLSLLVNNAGQGIKGTTTQTTDVDQYEQQMNLNLTSVFILSKYLLPALKNGNKNRRHSCYDGSIVNIGSVCGSAVYPIHTPYSVAKAGVAHLTKLNCIEFAPFGIRVNCIQPATVATNWHRASGWKEEDVALYYKNAQAMHPIGRAGTVSDLVQMIMFLANGSKTGWVTGQIITMDGGRLLKASLPQTDPAPKAKL